MLLIVMQTERIAGAEFKTQNDDQRVRKVFSVLSNKDILRILELASQGVLASDATPQKMKIPRGQFYKKLNQLCDLDLIMRDEEGVYRQTLIGEIVYQTQVLTLRRITDDANLTDLMAKFNIKNKSSNKIFETVVREITRDLIAMIDPGLWSLSQLKLFLTNEQYLSGVTSLISSTKNELYLAARSLELPMVDALITAAESSVKINMVYSDWRGFYSKNNNIDPLGDLINGASGKHPTAKLLSTTASVSYTRAQIPYSFVVSDSQRVAIEIADHDDPQSFFLGIGLESGAVAKKLVSYYDKFCAAIKRTEVA
jgi:sugar-specific transcriptional regulator TrmB